MKGDSAEVEICSAIARNPSIWTRHGSNLRVQCRLCSKSYLYLSRLYIRRHEIKHLWSNK